MGFSTGHHLDRSAHSRGDQSGGRCGIQNDSRSSGLEAISGGFLEDQCHLMFPGSRSVYLTPLLLTGPVLPLETGPSSTSNRCFSTGLGALKAYANPPWCLVGRVLKQVKAQQAQVILVAPVWKGQPWYPVLLEMLRDFPRWIPLSHDLFLMTSESVVMSFQPQLAVWPISGKSLLVRTF